MIEEKMKGGKNCTEKCIEDRKGQNVGMLPSLKLKDLGPIKLTNQSIKTCCRGQLCIYPLKLFRY